MKKWEYETITAVKHIELRRLLRQWGEYEWELVGVVFDGDYVAFLKREVVE